jgi:hypothetical protein
MRALHFTVVPVKEVVVADGQVEQVSRLDALWIVIVVLCDSPPTRLHALAAALLSR